MENGNKNSKKITENVLQSFAKMLKKPPEWRKIRNSIQIFTRRVSSFYSKEIYIDLLNVESDTSGWISRRNARKTN